MLRLKFAGAMFAIWLVITAVQKVDHSMHYVPATATLASVSSECHLYREQFYMVARRHSTTDDMPCADAEALRTSDPKFADFTVRGLIDVAFSYVSPVDRQEHRGTMSYAYEDYAPLATASAGSDLPILAHKTDPASYAHDYAHMAALATPKG